VQEVETTLPNGTGETEGGTGTNKPISLRLTPEERASVELAASRASLTKSDYIKARLFGTATRDRTSLVLINTLHVSGMALLKAMERVDADTRVGAEALALIAEMRTLVERIGRDLS
jgi:hypothetical protein